MSLSPRSLQTLGALLALAVFLGSLMLALRAPVLGVRLASDANTGLVVVAVKPGTEGLAAGQRLLSLGGVALNADHLIEEPDMLPSWARYRALMADMDLLAQALQPGGTVAAVLEDGRSLQLAVHARHWYQLPPMFWFQVGVGVLCFLLAYGVWVFRWTDPAARHFAVSGLGVMLAACCAAVYSTRELTLDGRWFYGLSVSNYTGAMLFTSALLMLLWHYPTRLGARNPGWLVYAVTWLAAIGFAFKLAGGPSTFTAAVLVLFALTFFGAFVQWRRTRGRPLERAALKWYLLSIYIGTGLFASVILLPGALHVEPIASQGLMFSVFLFMFAGIAMGIMRYRLFDLDRWWFGAWSWFLGGVCVLVLDVALVSLFDFSQAGALGLSLALLGWVYFPARQWLWARLAGHRAVGDRESLGHSLEMLAAAPDGEQLAQRWRQVLQDEFAPLELLAESCGDENSPRRVEIAENGLGLRLPDLVEGGGLLMRLPQAGARLFGRDDVARGDVLWRMAHHVQEAMHRREQDVQSERGRIMRDLHDDLGGKLLSLVYLGQGEARQIARSAMQDMRDVLSALAASPCRLADAVQEWQAETRQRLSALGRELTWSQDAMPADVRLSARQYTNLGRILREAVTNGLKHADARSIHVGWIWADGRLFLRVEDESPESAKPGGNGAAPAATLARTIGQRVQDLGGEVRWLAGAAGGTVVEVEVPVGPAS